MIKFKSRGNSAAVGISAADSICANEYRTLPDGFEWHEYPSHFTVITSQSREDDEMLSSPVLCTVGDIPLVVGNGVTWKGRDFERRKCFPRTDRCLVWKEKAKRRYGYRVGVIQLSWSIDVFFRWSKPIHSTNLLISSSKCTTKSTWIVGVVVVSRTRHFLKQWIRSYAYLVSLSCGQYKVDVCSGNSWDNTQ